LNPGRIVIELTERIMVLNSQRAQRKIQVLQEAGFLFSVDDFGTGYSSLALLRGFDFDFIKIDQHFIHNIGLAGPDAPLVQAMIAMAKSLGLLAVAEGVETQEQKDLLLELGCAYGQGYFFYKPMSGADLKVILSSKATPPLH
jgi:EAL domain-containing protein (putative c-di-GMP-specific phosphodiesterase class I)